MKNSPTSENEYRRVIRDRLECVRSSLDDILGQIRRLSVERDRLQDEKRHLLGLIGDESLTESSASDGDRSGEQSIPDAVAQILEEHGPTHYKDISRHLQAAGFAPTGSDPDNTFLVKYYLDPRFYRPARGTYALTRGKNVKSVGKKRRGNRRRKNS